jgi:hypothetical protein
MEIKVVIDEKLLNQIFQLEAVKLVGKCLKRFELTDDKDLIKKEVKELLYEGLRDIRDMLAIYGKESIRLSPCKEGEKDVK